MNIYQFLKEWKGRNITIVTKRNEGIYKGILKEVEGSAHGGIGNILLQNSEDWVLIRGSCVFYFQLEE